MSAAPEIAVVVPTRERPLRLRWLLVALAGQTLSRERFEVLIAHDAAGSETEALLRADPLAANGTLRALVLPAGAGPAAKRNAAWHAARAPLIAFTDDDCRPPSDWLERALAAARAHPGAIVQGATRPDPEEADLERAPGARSQAVRPPSAWGQTCNIVYPRAVLEVAGGFDETLPDAAGEDADLAQRALAAGAALVAAPEVLTHHAVETRSLAARVRDGWRWRHLPGVVARHPGLRSELVGGVFWKPAHARLALAAGGLLGARRRRGLALLALPWVAGSLDRYGPSARGRLRGLAELPSRAVEDGAELAALATGSIRHRTLVL